MKIYLQASGQMAESSSVHDANIFQLWVKLEDHRACVAELESEIAELNRRLTAIEST